MFDMNEYEVNEHSSMLDHKTHCATHGHSVLQFLHQRAVSHFMPITPWFSSDSIQ